MDNEKRFTALIIHDDPYQLRLMSAILEEDGFQVISCQSAETALQIMCEQGPVDVIVTDLCLPGLGGWRLCHLLRSPEYGLLNHTPILVISASFTGAGTEQVAVDLGANAFLPAPYEPAA